MLSRTILAILLPIVFGLLAAVMHYRTLQGQKGEMHSYLVAAERLALGGKLRTVGDGINVANIKLPSTLKLDQQFISTDQAVLYDGLALTRQLEPGTPILRSDLATPEVFRLTAGKVAVNVSLEGVKYEPRFLAVGEPVRFVYEDFEFEEPVFRLTAPFRVVAIGDGTTLAARATDGRPATICIEVDEELDTDVNAQLLLELIAQNRIVAIAFGARSPG